jgi:hypothetical protein
MALRKTMKGLSGLAIESDDVKCAFGGLMQ